MVTQSPSSDQITTAFIRNGSASHISVSDELIAKAYDAENVKINTISMVRREIKCFRPTEGGNGEKKKQQPQTLCVQFYPDPF